LHSIGAFEIFFPESTFAMRISLSNILNSPATDADSPDELLETYHFAFPSVGDGNPRISIRTERSPSADFDMRSTVKANTIGLLRKLISTCDLLLPLPEDRILTMRLLYKDDITPPDFQPPLFRDCTGDSALAFDENPIRMNLGSVETPHHQIKLRIKALPSMLHSTDMTTDEVKVDVVAPTIAKPQVTNKSSSLPPKVLPAVQQSLPKPNRTFDADDNTSLPSMSPAGVGSAQSRDVSPDLMAAAFAKKMQIVTQEPIAKPAVQPTTAVGLHSMPDLEPASVADSSSLYFHAAVHVFLSRLVEEIVCHRPVCNCDEVARASSGCV
jgi:hypothetical protein